MIVQHELKPRLGNLFYMVIKVEPLSLEQTGTDDLQPPSTSISSM
jgi:hypothetical protein